MQSENGISYSGLYWEQHIQLIVKINIDKTLYIEGICKTVDKQNLNEQIELQMGRGVTFGDQWGREL